MANNTSIWQALLNKRILICIFTGFSSGLPLYILISLLPAWLRSEGVNLKAIGLFALISLPFTWKFLWAPLFDRYIPPLGRRRGWLLISQILLLLSIPMFGAFNPKLDIWTIAYLASVVAFFSASQDVVLDAYRRELLLDSELGFRQCSACKCLQNCRIDTRFTVIDIGGLFALAKRIPDYRLIYVAWPVHDNIG